MGYKLEPSKYPCPEHPKVDLSEKVWREVLTPAADGTWTGARGSTFVGGDFTAQFDGRGSKGSLLRRALSYALRKRSLQSPEGPFTIRVQCPGVPGTNKDEDKPHRQTIRGVVHEHSP